MTTVQDSPADFPVGIEGNYDDIIYDLDEDTAHRMNDVGTVGVRYTRGHGVRTGEYDSNNNQVKLNVGLFSVCDTHSGCLCETSEWDGLEDTFTWRYDTVKVDDIDEYKEIVF